MSRILHAIQERMDQLYKQEKKLAEYIVEHPQETVGLSITQLAKYSGTSTATITRFCKSMHFGGFTQFKIKLAAELAHSDEEASYQDIVAGNPLQRIVSVIEANHIRSITDTTRLLDFKQLEAAINALREARRIDLYGMATSGIVAQDFYQKLIRIGLQVTAFSDPHMQITSASNLRKGDVAFAISYSGETAETISALRCAKECEATTISLTKYGSNTLASMADISLFASSLEEGMRRGDLASRIAQLHLIDMVFIGLISDQFNDYVPRLEKSYRMVKKYREERR